MSDDVKAAIADALRRGNNQLTHDRTGRAERMASIAFDAAVEAGMAPAEQVSVYSDADGRLHVSTLIRERNEALDEIERFRDEASDEIRFRDECIARLHAEVERLREFAQSVADEYDPEIDDEWMDEDGLYHPDVWSIGNQEDSARIVQAFYDNRRAERARAALDREDSR